MQMMLVVVLCSKLYRRDTAIEDEKEKQSTLRYK